MPGQGFLCFNIFWISLLSQPTARSDFTARMVQPPAKNISGQTNFTPHHLEYEWSVDNFLALFDPTESAERFNVRITSPTFSVPGAPQYEFNLQLYPNGCDEETKDYVVLNLPSEKFPDILGIVKCKISFSGSMKAHSFGMYMVILYIAI